MKKCVILLLIISCQTQAALPPEYRLQRDNDTRSCFIEAHPLIKKNLINEKQVTYYFPTSYGDKICQVQLTRNHPKTKQTIDVNGSVITQPRPAGPAPVLTFKSSNCPTSYTALNKHLSDCRHAQATLRHVLGSTKNDHAFHELPICKRPKVSNSELTKRLTKLLDATLASELTPDELKETTIQKTFYDLNGDGLKVAIVHLQSKEFCGSGGCATHVYQLDIVNGKPTYQPISHIGLSKAPIYVLDSQTNGWHDIGVHISGGGITPQDVALKFNDQQSNDAKGYPRSGKNSKYIGYPTNPTSSKYGNYIQSISGKPKGVLVIR